MIRMHSRFTAPALVLAALAFAACADPVEPLPADAPEAVAAEASVALADAPFAAISDKACWGQATKVFAQTGKMGQHAAQQATPRDGLRNLARELYKMGVIPEPTMQALGAFVANELGLTIDACL